MIKPEMQAAINQQINQELAASYSYLGMCAYFEGENLGGFAKWCLVQQQEEYDHAMRLFQYLLDRGGKVDLDAIASPKSDYDSVLGVFKTALKQEVQNTESINTLYKLATDIGDHTTISHLQWFLDEQVEEEKVVGEIVALVERAKDNVNAIFFLNEKLGKRTPESPAA